MTENERAELNEALNRDKYGEFYGQCDCCSNFIERVGVDIKCSFKPRVPFSIRYGFVSCGDKNPLALGGKE